MAAKTKEQPVQSIDRAMAKRLQEELDAAIKPVLEKHGLKEGRPSKVSYAPNSIKFTAEAGLLIDGNAETKEAVAYRRLADVYQMKPEWLFKEVRTVRGKIVKITGLNVNAHKMPILGEQDGKSYKFPAAAFVGAKLLE